MKRIPINEFIKDIESQKDNYYGFYDWFCSDKALRNRAISLIPKVKFLVDQGVINGATTYVWFKNNCPIVGDLYDDMRFSLLDEGNTYLGGIAPTVGYTSSQGTCTVWLIVDGRLFDRTFESWGKFEQELKTDTRLRAELKKHFYRG